MFSLQVTEDLGVLPMNSVDRDVLEVLSNEEAITARRVVDAMKLSKQEIQEQLVLPEVCTTCSPALLAVLHKQIEDRRYAAAAGV